jgi:hypothetical protein
LSRPLLALLKEALTIFFLRASESVMLFENPEVRNIRSDNVTANFGIRFFIFVVI